MGKLNKKVIILWHSGGRLANQLWLAIGVYAYCLHRGYKFENHSFFEYASLFNFTSGNKLIDWLYFRPFPVLKKILPKSWYANNHKYFFRYYYKLYVKLTEFFFRRQMVYAPDGDNPVVHYLPPSANIDADIDNFEKNDSDKIYLSGWLFRNPVGIEKYRAEIKEYFKPKKGVLEKIDSFVADLRSKYGRIIGVHIRQGDYRAEFGGGKLFFDEDEVLVILNQYLKTFNLKSAETVFVLCSDESLDLGKFTGLNITCLPNSTAIEDLFLLARTDTIVGSDSTFGSFASYYGNIPLIIFQHGEIDWAYYEDKTGYFLNKYSITNI